MSFMDKFRKVISSMGKISPAYVAFAGMGELQIEGDLFEDSLYTGPDDEQEQDAEPEPENWLSQIPQEGAVYVVKNESSKSGYKAMLHEDFTERFGELNDQGLEKLLIETNSSVAVFGHQEEFGSLEYHPSEEVIQVINQMLDQDSACYAEMDSIWDLARDIQENYPSNGNCPQFEIY